MSALPRAEPAGPERSSRVRSDAEIGLAEHLETHVVESHARLLDVVDVHGHGGAVSGVHDQAGRRSEC